MKAKQTKRVTDESTLTKWMYIHQWVDVTTGEAIPKTETYKYTQINQKTNKYVKGTKGIMETIHHMAPSKQISIW